MDESLVYLHYGVSLASQILNQHDRIRFSDSTVTFMSYLPVLTPSSKEEL